MFLSRNVSVVIMTS